MPILEKLRRSSRIYPAKREVGESTMWYAVPVTPPPACNAWACFTAVREAILMWQLTHTPCTHLQIIVITNRYHIIARFYPAPRQLGFSDYAKRIILVSECQSVLASDATMSLSPTIICSHCYFCLSLMFTQCHLTIIISYVCQKWMHCARGNVGIMVGRDVGEGQFYDGLRS